MTSERLPSIFTSRRVASPRFVVARGKARRLHLRPGKGTGGPQSWRLMCPMICRRLEQLGTAVLSPTRPRRLRCRRAAHRLGVRPRPCPRPASWCRAHPVPSPHGRTDRGRCWQTPLPGWRPIVLYLGRRDKARSFRRTTRALDPDRHSAGATLEVVDGQRVNEIHPCTYGVLFVHTPFVQRRSRV